MNGVLSGLLLIACQVIYHGSPSLAAVPVCNPEQLVEASICTSLNLCGSGLESLCSITCGLCQPPPPTTAPPVTTPAPTTLPVCTPEQLVEATICTSLNLCGSGLESQCSITCGLCQPPPPTTAPPVTTPAPTTLPVCTPEQLVEATICTSLNLCGSGLESQCSITCGLCQPPPPTTQPPETTAAVTTESSTTTETPTTITEPSTTESSTTTETPTTITEPSTTESSTTTETPTTITEPSTTESSTTTETPTTITEPSTMESSSVTETPTTINEPSTMESSSGTETPTTITEPSTTESSTTTETPTTITEPSTTESSTTTEIPTTMTPQNVCCIFVTLAIYSGRQDPRWLISSTDNDTLCTGILIHITQANSLNQLLPHTCMPRKTGYKGFLVQVDENEYLIVGNDTSSLQLKLLETMPRKLQPTVEFRQRIRSEILLGNISADCPSNRPGITKRFAPPYEPDLFNADENTRRLNNCYNYASTIVTNSYAQPGRATGGPFFPLLTAAAIQAAAIRDGFADLTPVPGSNAPVPETPMGSEHLVAVFYVNDTCGGDFHFYRLDDGGLWSHKPGQTGATRLDDSGANITDPRSADTGAYIFQRFLVVNNNTVRII